MSTWDFQIEELYSKYSPLLRNLCRKRVNGNPIYEDLIEECIQDVFIVAYRERKKLQEIVNMQAWLIQVCMNRFIPRLQQYDRRRKRESFSIDDPVHEGSHPAVDAIGKYVEVQEIKAFQLRLKQQLDDDEKKVFSYYFENDMTMAAIGDKLELSDNRVRYLIQRIRKKAKEIRSSIK